MADDIVGIADLRAARPGTREIERGGVVATRAEHWLRSHQVRPHPVVVQQQDVFARLHLEVRVAQTRRWRRGLAAFAPVAWHSEQVVSSETGSTTSSVASDCPEVLSVAVNAHQRIPVCVPGVVDRDDRNAFRLEQVR